MDVWDLALAILAFLLSMVGWSVRDMKVKLDKCITKEEVENLVDLKQEATKYIQAELKEDIALLQVKMDKILEELRNGNRHNK